MLINPPDYCFAKRNKSIKILFRLTFFLDHPSECISMLIDCVVVYPVQPWPFMKRLHSGAPCDIPQLPEWYQSFPSPNNLPQYAITSSVTKAGVRWQLEQPTHCNTCGYCAAVQLIRRSSSCWAVVCSLKYVNFVTLLSHSRHLKVCYIFPSVSFWNI